MSLLIYGILFWIFAVVTIFLKSSTSVKIKNELRTVIKAIPAFSAFVFILYSALSVSLFYTLLAIALFFCALGDIGMEYNILPGLGLFLFSHIFYTINFVWQSVLLGVDLLPLTVFIICLAGMIVYIIMYYRYLKTTEQEIPDILLKSVIVYAFMISLTLSTSLLLWLTSDVSLGFLPFVGAILFVISDSIIGIREFHHHMKHEEIVILSTYYLAIFLLSIGVLIYLF